MSAGTIIGVLLFIAHLIYKAMNASNDQPLHSQNNPVDNEPTYSKQQLAEFLAQVKACLEEVGDRLQRLNKLIDDSEHDYTIFADLLNKQVASQHKSTGIAYQKLLKQLEQLPARNRDLEPINNSLGPMLVHSRVIESLFEWREDPQLSEILGDGDAIAHSLLLPFEELAFSEDVAFSTSTVFCAPTLEGQESVWFDLLPKNYLLVFMPRNFNENLNRWAALPHEIGHVLWRQVPGFSDAVLARLKRSLGFYKELQLEHDFKLNIHEYFELWIEEIVADAFTALMLGPAALRSFIHCFKNSNQAELVSTVHVTEEGYLDVHPPEHLRVLLVAALLYKIGFDRESNALVKQWNKMHDFPENLVLHTRSGPVQIPVKPLVEAGNEFFDAFYHGGYKCFAGRELQSIHGLEMTPGRWASVDRASKALRAGRAVKQAPSIVLAAGIEAQVDDSPLHIERIGKLMMASIKGLYHKEDRQSVNLKEESSDLKRLSINRLTQQDVQDGLLFAEIINRPRFGRVPVKSRV